MPTRPDKVITLGMERSILPGPEVMTSICPSPTITKNMAKSIAACSDWMAPDPPESTSVISQMTIAPRKE